MNKRYEHHTLTIRRATLAIAFFSCVVTAQAQIVNGSVYNYYGIGNLQGRNSAYNRALGFTGVGVRDNSNINGINPASYNSIGKPFTTLFEIGANYEAVTHETLTNSAVSKTGGLNGINFMVKPSSKFGFIIGTSPLSSISYAANENKQFPSLSTPTVITHEGSGGINQFYFGAAYELFKNFSIGGNLAYYLGTIKKIDNIPSTAVSPPLIVNNKTALRNSGFDAGFQYTINFKEKSVTIGGTWDPGVRLNGNQQTSIVNLNLDTISKTLKTDVQYRLPPSYGAGLAFKTKRSTLAADVRYVEWKSAVMNDFNVNYQNTTRFSMGYEYRGNPVAVKYLDIISFRGGVFVQDYPVVLNTAFKTWGYTVGVGLPLQNYRASVNINYSYIQLGTTAGTLVKESSGKLVIDFIIRDIWGIKRQFD